MKAAGMRFALVVLLVALLGRPVGAQPAPAPPIPPQTVRSLAENVLGSGTVRAVQITEEGATVLIRWGAATYRRENKLETTRELLYAEAELATGSIMGRLTQVGRVRFAILLKEQIIASGENLRGKGVVMIFAAAFGGGTLQPGAPKGGTPNQKGGGTDAAKD